MKTETLKRFAEKVISGDIITEDLEKAVAEYEKEIREDQERKTRQACAEIIHESKDDNGFYIIRSPLSIKQAIMDINTIKED